MCESFTFFFYAYVHVDTLLKAALASFLFFLPSVLQCTISGTTQIFFSARALLEKNPLYNVSHKKQGTKLLLPFWADEVLKNPVVLVIVQV